jgi:hypothetical protein
MRAVPAGKPVINHTTPWPKKALNTSQKIRISREMKDEVYNLLFPSTKIPNQIGEKNPPPMKAGSSFNLLWTFGKIR